MPSADAEVTATYTDKTWTLTVNSGIGDGSYVVATVVDIHADAPASGKQFDEWVGDTSGIASVTTADTTLTMPYANAEVTATYEDASAGTTQLIVNWGDSAENNVYDFSDWDNVYLGPYTSYSSAGPDGMFDTGDDQTMNDMFFEEDFEFNIEDGSFDIPEGDFSTPELPEPNLEPENMNVKEAGDTADTEAPPF